MSNKGKCEKHSKDLEMFCFDCEGVKKPMCSLCMCEYVKTLFPKTPIVHVADLIRDGLKEVEANIQNISKLQNQLKEYDNKATNNKIAKGDLKANLDEKLLRMKNFIEEQGSLASVNYVNILRCYEDTCKKIKKSESKIKESINDPHLIEKKVKDMIEKQKYWEGYEEVNRAVEDTKKLDDAEINKNFAEYEKLLNEHQNILDTLDMIPKHASEYRLLKEENEQLKRSLSNKIK